MVILGGIWEMWEARGNGDKIVLFLLCFPAVEEGTTVSLNKQKGYCMCDNFDLERRQGHSQETLHRLLEKLPEPLQLNAARGMIWRFLQLC